MSGKEFKESSVLNHQWKKPGRNSICFAESTKALELATLGPLGIDVEVKLKTRGQLERWLKKYLENSEIQLHPCPFPVPYSQSVHYLCPNRIKGAYPLQEIR